MKRSGYLPLTENATEPRAIRNKSNSIGYTVKLRLMMKPSMISAESEIQRKFSSRPDTFTIIPPVLIRTESVEYSNTPLLPSISSSRLPLSSIHGAFSEDKKGDRRFVSFCFSFIVSPIHFMMTVAYILSVSKNEGHKIILYQKNNRIISHSSRLLSLSEIYAGMCRGDQKRDPVLHRGTGAVAVCVHDLIIGGDPQRRCRIAHKAVWKNSAVSVPTASVGLGGHPAEHPRRLSCRRAVCGDAV